jgi:citrate synthase
MSEVIHGLEGIVLTETRLSRVDGEAGKLIIAGFAVEALAPVATYEETLFLLWNDRLPTAAELASLRAELAGQRNLPAEVFPLLRSAAARRLHPMDALRTGAATLGLLDHAPRDDTREANQRRALTLVACFPTIVAAYRRLLDGDEPIEPDRDLGHAANYLYMLTGELPGAEATRAMETYLNTVIDHGMNASTFAARVIVSTRSDMTSAVVGAVGALKGPLHGGAPGPALDMVFEIREQARESGRPIAEEARFWAESAVRSGKRLMGFGHRVYKVRDPRAEVLDRAAALLFANREDRALYDDARLVEDALLSVLQRLKPDRRLETNVEFYTALILHGIGLDAELFSSTFAISRVGGWTAHVLEQIDEDRLIRPRAAYVGGYDRVWQVAEAREAPAPR